MAVESLKHSYEKNSLCHSVTLAWFSIQILVNSKTFKLSLNLSLTHVRAQIACYELKRDLSPVMLDEIFPESFENFETMGICMEKFLGLIEITSGLVNASFSLPEWQAVKMIFFSPWTGVPHSM